MRGDVSSSPLNIGYQAPVTTSLHEAHGGLNTRAADLRRLLLCKMETWNSIWSQQVWLNVTPSRGRTIRTGGVSLPDENITDREDSFYQYVGILQANGNLEEAKRKSATAKIPPERSHLLRPQLNGRNKAQATNTYVLPLIRYPAGIVNWCGSLFNTIFPQ